MPVNKVVIPLLFLTTGFVSAYIIFSPPAENKKNPVDNLIDNTIAANGSDKIINPLAVTNNNIDDTQRLKTLEAEVSLIKEQLHEIALALQEQAVHNERPPTGNAQTTITTHRPAYRNTRFTSVLSQRLYNFDNLIRGGIDQILAEDIVRRKNANELKKLQLQDLAKRGNYLNTQRYYDELDALEENDVNLRKELGDHRYDEYLFNSKQNNRIKINSVMLGSTAEQAGILKGDVVLSYDNAKVYNWQELKNATTEGELGEYVSISILRNGQIFSYSVPRGPLGLQLGATRIQP